MSRLTHFPGWRMPLILLVPMLCFPVWADNQLEIFELREQFGISHPNQIVTFDFGGSFNPSLTYMLDAVGREVLFQRMSDNSVAVQTALEPNQTRVWRLMTGRAPVKLPGSVSVREGADYYEITNGITGVRVLRSSATKDTRLAPIQGILLQNGVWSATGPNYVRKGHESTSVFFKEPLPAKSVTTTVIERGPLQITLEVAYEYDRPDLRWNGKLAIPAGDGYFKSRITLQAGQPSILIEDDTDMDLQYYLDFYGQIQPDQYRWRSGRVDEVRSFQTKLPAFPFTSTGPSLDGQRHYYKFLSAWNPWSAEVGFYSMLYNAAAGPDSPVVGIFPGRASRALGTGSTGPAPFYLPESFTGKREGGYWMFIRRIGEKIWPRVRFNWAIFVGTKSDLRGLTQHQNIHRQMNLHGGFNLNKISRYRLEYDDPPGGYRPMFLDSEAADSLIQRVRTDSRYADWLVGAEPMAGPLVNIWRDASGVAAQQAAQEISTFAGKMLDALVNLGGIYHFDYHYWHGGTEMARRSILINELLRSNQLSQEHRKKVKAAAALFSAILMDEDFVPLSNAAGVNLGTPNMPIQQSQYRQQYMILMAHHPMMQGLSNEILHKVSQSINAEINEFGSHRAATHYIAASIAPLLSTAAQLRAANLGDPFQSEPRLLKFARFYMNLLTPPEIRFGGLRKMVAVGDSATEGSEVYGLLATGLATVDSGLSKQLMRAWAESGRPHNFFNGSTVVKINDELPEAPFVLKSDNYPGYCSVLRHGGGTINETAVWFVNGDFYSDHRHNDHGAVSIYALQAPLSIDWGSVAYPSVGGAYMHSGVVPEGAIGKAWDADDIDTRIPTSPWSGLSQGRFQSFDLSTSSTATFQSPDGTNWTRTVRTIAANPDYPAIIISDRFAGAGASTAKIFTLNLMAQDTVMSSVGAINPPSRTYDANAGLRQFPSAPTPMALEAGVHRFSFIGQWKIDWDLFQMADHHQQVLIGNWAHRWVPGLEQNQFRSANGRSFEERQHIFRLKGSDAFDVLLLPFRKGEARPGLRVTSTAGVTTVNSSDDQLVYSADFYYYRNGQQQVLTTFTATGANRNGLEISGGPAEVILRNGRAVISVQGDSGQRRIKLPAAFLPKGPVALVNGVYLIDYQGGDSIRVELSLGL